MLEFKEFAGNEVNCVVSERRPVKTSVEVTERGSSFISFSAAEEDPTKMNETLNKPWKGKHHERKLNRENRDLEKELSKVVRMSQAFFLVFS